MSTPAPPPCPKHLRRERGSSPTAERAANLLGVTRTFQLAASGVTKVMAELLVPGDLVLENVDQPGMVGSVGSILGRANVNIAEVVRQTIKEIGYNTSSMGFDWETCAVLTAIEKQSGDIAMGVDKALEAEADGLWRLVP